MKTRPFFVFAVFYFYPALTPLQRIIGTKYRTQVSAYGQFHLTVDVAIQKHEAMKVFETAAEGERGNPAPLLELGLIIEKLDDAERISYAAYKRLTVAEKAANYWEASQGLTTSRKAKSLFRGTMWVIRLALE